MKQNPKINLELDFVVELLDDIINEEKYCSHCACHRVKNSCNTCKECITFLILTKYKNYLNRDKIIAEKKQLEQERKQKQINENRIKNEQTRKELEELSKHLYVVYE